MAWAHNITQKVMNASHAYLASSGIPTIPASSIYAGIDDETLANPRVVCLCPEAILTEAPYSGNWSARLDIIVRTNADDTSPDSHLDTAGEVFSKFASPTILEDLSGAIPDFFVGQLVFQRQSYEREDRSWVSTFSMQLECAGSAITQS